jgi:hypothetical protein
MTRDNKKNFSGRLDRLALSLSGGGVRAIGFHLGTMSMLQRLGLLEKVQILSSVSGGSMPGIGYALSQAVGRPFQDFFDDYFEFLPQLNVIEEMMARIVAKEPPSPSGRRDMITALANIHEEFYFNRFFGEYAGDGPLTFDILMREPRQGHLEEIIFNATEFKTGTAFRFQISAYRCLIGNRNIALCHKHARQIRIADIMAASSCIPVGMEPLFFPDDFHWPDDGKWRRGRRPPERPTCSEINRALECNLDTGLPSFALMDGGVYDNQGVTSTLNALNRRKEGIKQADSPECGFSLSGRGDPPGPKEWANWMSGRVVPGAEHRTVDVDSSDLDLLIISDTPVREASIFPKVTLTASGVPEQVGRLARHARRANSWLGRVTLGQASRTASIVRLAGRNGDFRGSSPGDSPDTDSPDAGRPDPDQGQQGARHRGAAESHTALEEKTGQIHRQASPWRSHPDGRAPRPLGVGPDFQDLHEPYPGTGLRRGLQPGRPEKPHSR